MGVESFPQLVEAYLDRHLQRKSSYPYYRRLVRQCFHEWHDWPTKADIRQWHLDRRQTPTHANKGLSFLKALYNWAINEGLWIEPNPAQGIRRYQTWSRDRILINQELRLLLTHLDMAPLKLAVYLVQLLTTGCRMSEARTMDRDLVDLTLGRWRKVLTKNGQGQWTPLPRQSVDYLQRIPLKGQWFFAGHYGHPWSRAAAEKAWGEFRASLGLKDVTLHDFRRTVATRLYEQERDELLVKACLNHYDGRPIAVYVRLQYDRLAQALQTHADRLWALRERDDQTLLPIDDSLGLVPPELRADPRHPAA